MWIARDKNDRRLKMFFEKPVDNNGIWEDKNSPYAFQLISYDWSPMVEYKEQYPELTYENSPKELIVKN